jgi:hypothetical protein
LCSNPSDVQSHNKPIDIGPLSSSDIPTRVVTHPGLSAHLVVISNTISADEYRLHSTMNISWIDDISLEQDAHSSEDAASTKIVAGDTLNVSFEKCSMRLARFKFSL